MSPKEPVRLNSWKEIASHLGRSVRSVQRWEREEGLPIHRLAHEKRGSVYAYRHELDCWWESHRTTLSATPDEESAANQASPETAVPAIGHKPMLPVSRWSLVIASVICAVVIAAIAMFRRPAAEGSLAPTRLTMDATAQTDDCSISADGSFVVYAANSPDPANVDILLRRRGEDHSTRLTEDPAIDRDPSLSPDSTRLLFQSSRRQGPGVYEMQVRGGLARLIVADARSARYSPDGEFVSFVRDDKVWVMPSNGGKEREIPTGPAAWGPRSSAPLWSPDGKYLLIDEVGTLEHNGYWWLLPVNGGRARRIDTSARPDKFNVQRTYQWLSDNRILFSAARRGDSTSKIWISRLSGDWNTAGFPVRATDTTDSEPAACATPNLLAFVRQSVQINLWTLPVDGNAGKVLGTLRPLTHGAAFVVDASLSADGNRLAFSADRSGNDFDIYVRDMASGADKLIAGTPVRELYSTLTPDGRKVAWGNVVKSGRPVFVADTEAGTMRQICDDCQGRPGAWLPDGRHLILLHVDSPKRDTLAVLDTETGRQVQILASNSGNLRMPRVSPDGHWIAFWRQAGAGNVLGRWVPGEPTTVFVAPYRDLVPVPESEWVSVGEASTHPVWSQDGNSIYFYSHSPSGGGPFIRRRRFDSASGQFVGPATEFYQFHDWENVQGLVGLGPGQLLIDVAGVQGDVWLTALTPK